MMGEEEDDELMGLGQEFLREKQLDKALNDAQAGQNLLSFVDDPKPALYGDQMFSPRSDRSMGRQGSALMDFFVDPTQIFASERHPALQEVLAVLSKSKKHRGIYVKMHLDSKFMY